MGSRNIKGSTELSVIDSIEFICANLGVDFLKSGDMEVCVAFSRNGFTYPILISMRREIYETVYFSCDIGFSIPQHQFEKAAVVVVKANERSWLGHFDIISSGDHFEYNLIYTFTIPFALSFRFDEDNLRNLLDVIAGECERFRQYFEMAMKVNSKNGLSDLSLNTLFFEAMGEA